jgi:acetophenone carboxylase
LQWAKPLPPSPKELECLELLQLGDYEIYNEKLNNFLTETREVFIRMGITSMLRSGDLIVGIYTAAGDMVTASCGTYIHAVTAQLPTKFVVNNWLNNPTVGIEDGDIFYANEATYGGIHNCDQIAMMPVFNDGELIAWTVSCVHEPETGGLEPGGVCPSARTICDEGMRLIPIKIGEKFRLRDDLIEMMENMIVRTPRMQAIDVRARVTACDRLRRRVLELAKQKGNDFVVGLFRKLMMEAEEGAKRRIRNWNDGTYRIALFLDSQGRDDSLLRIFCELRKEGRRLVFDFTGTSPEHDGGSYHALPHQLLAPICVYLYAYAFHDLPVSSGSLVPLEVIVPEGSLYNPSPMAPIASSPPALLPVTSLSYILFAKMMFDSPERHLIAGSAADGTYTLVAGINQWGVPVADITSFGFNTEGQGARFDMDGVDAYGFCFCHVGKAPDAEYVEGEFPLLHLYQKFAKDTCGHGKYRGGSGTTSAHVIHHVPWAAMQSMTVSHRVTTNLGIFGGYPHAARPGVGIANTNLWEKMTRGDKDIPSDTLQLLTERAIQGIYTVESANRTTRPMMNGDILIDISAGGPGYGDVLERAPEMVMEDLRREIISHLTAQNVYHVAYDPGSFEVDYKKTEELRQKEREARKIKGKSWDEFVQEWSSKKPPEEALKWYGSWPDARTVSHIIRI